MGKKLKKGKSGNAAQYLTRNQALKKLQLGLGEFRRLCILKGIHPREPKKKPQGQNKTYYHVKDILYMAHEPLVRRFREKVVHNRKIRKAKARKNMDLARRLLSRQPTYKLDHLVKERYPTFVDALRDLDDALTLIHLFATLPSTKKYGIPSTMVQTSRRLSLEWQAYVVRTSSLRKTFISVKGFYFQANILGQDITWLVPHQLAQVLPPDVDYRVMRTFLEFYQTLVQFVNFKLYHLVGVKYPPIVDPRMEEAAAGLASIMQDLAQPPTTQAPNQSLITAGDAALDPEASQRLEGLQDKLRELQKEGAEAMAASEPAVPPKDTDSSEEEDAPEIESGSDEASGEQDAANLAEAGEAEVEGRRETVANAGAVVPSKEVQEIGGPQALIGGAVDAIGDAEVCATLFRGLIFYLGREVPREQLLVVIRSFGGQVGWEGDESPLQEDDSSITHQVVDRPSVSKQISGREYVQPQWVVDSANFRVLADTRLYAPALTPPPHLSPFVDADEEGYVPDYLAELQKMQESANAMRKRAQGVVIDTAFLQEQPAAAANGDPASDVAAAEDLYQKELQKEIGVKRKAEARAEEIEEGEDKAEADKNADEEAMNKAVMKRKDRHLYQAILNRQRAKRQKVTKLQKKRDALRQSSQ